MTRSAGCRQRIGSNAARYSPEFYVGKLAKSGVKLVSTTQEMGDDPMRVMMRQNMALFDENQSKENAKHVLRAMTENARQGFWNGARPPIGYRIVAVQQREAKIKKLEVDIRRANKAQITWDSTQRWMKEGAQVIAMSTACCHFLGTVAHERS